MKILIVDDHPIYAEGLKNLLLSWNYDEVSIARDAPEALVMARQTKPDVVLMDISLPGMDGIQATIEMKREHPDMKIVMLTSLGEEESLFRAIRAGASGYLIKTLNGEELVNCLSDLKTGKNPFSPGLEDTILSELRRSYAAPEAMAEKGDQYLTRRQREVLRLMAKGNSYKQIGKELFISERTVKFHIEQAKASLGLKTKEQLIDFIERGPAD